MAKVKKMAFGGMGSKVAAAAKALPKVAPAISQQITNAAPQNMNAAFNASNLARASSMATNAAPRQPLTQANPFGVGMKQDTAALNKIGQAAMQKPNVGTTPTKPMPGSGSIGFPGGPGGKTTYGTGPMPRMAKAEMQAPVGNRGAAGAALGKAMGMMKKGGVTRADGCITKGHTKGRVL